MIQEAGFGYLVKEMHPKVANIEGDMSEVTGALKAGENIASNSPEE